MAYDFERFFNLSIDMLCIAGSDGYFKRINPSFTTTLGWSQEELLSKPFIEFVHPDDVASTKKEMDKLAAGLVSVFFENRYLCKDGSYKVLLWTAYPDNENSLLYAIARNITGIKHEEEKLLITIEASPSAMIMVKGGGTIVMANDEALRIFGYSKEEMIGSDIELIIPESLKSRHQRLCSDFFNDTQTRYMGKGRDLLAIRKDGSEFPVEVGLNPVTISNHKYVLCAIADLTYRKKYEESILEQAAKLKEINDNLNQLATTDPLTDVMNRRAYFEQLKYQLALAYRNEGYLSLIMADVDRFKEYNDTYGHPAGDAVLKEVARLMKSAARGSDFVARYGGEEFAVTLVNTDKAQAVFAAERFREIIEEQQWENRAITISIGIMTIKCHGHEHGDPDKKIASIIEAADKALYVSKKQGRNRSTHYDDI